MHPRDTGFICVILIAGLLCCAGCTSSPAPAAPPAPSPVPATVPSVPVVSPVPVVIPTQETTKAIPVPSPTPVPTTPWLEKPSTAESIDNPYVLGFSYKKEALRFDTPNCGMMQAFPEAAGDPAYGILQPEVRHILVNPDKISDFILTNAGDHRNDPNPENFINGNLIGGSECSGAIGNPKWNFIRINATLVPRNAKPAVYDIGINVRSHGRILTQLRMNETLTLDKQVILAQYIPVKSQEMEELDTLDLVIVKRR